MKISELPTPRLRARAIELALLSVGSGYIHEELDLMAAFHWKGESHEGHNFWAACDEGNWDKAKELQPSLFKPMDGKPHIKLVNQVYSEELGIGVDWTLDVVNWHSVDKEILDLTDSYVYSIHPDFYPTIQEAVDALYSFKRGSANEDT